MSLPEIKYPIHNVFVAGIGDVKVRPFNGHEEKSLLTTKESDELKDTMAALDGILRACTFNEYGTDNLALFQVEQLFLGIRSVSVGPTSDVYLDNNVCEKEECPKAIHLTIDLSAPVVETFDGEQYDDKQHKDQLAKTILIDDDSMGVTVKCPSADRVAQFQQQYDPIEAMAIASLDKPFDKDNVYTNFSDQEIADWYFNIPYVSRSEIETFVLQTPTLVYRSKWTCPNCQNTEDVILEGLDSFFG